MLHIGGIGIAGKRIVITLHKNFNSYTRFTDRLSQNPLLTGDSASFMVDLKDETRNFRSLFMSQVAN